MNKKSSSSPRRTTSRSGTTSRSTSTNRRRTHSSTTQSSSHSRTTRTLGKATKQHARTATHSGPKVKIMVLGGCEEVGRNMSLIEYENDIVIIDMGLQFPEEDMPGIDYIIPNISYLKGKEKNIRGVFITHGHYDHIGAIPHLIPELGNPPMYMGRLTAGIVKKRHEQYRNLAALNITLIDETSSIKAGKMTVEFVRVNHSIPDSFGIVVHTPMGTVLHTGDYKFDFNPVDDKPADLARFAKIGMDGVLALMSDSTSSSSEGYQVSESTVGDELHKVFATSEGRIIIGTFASQLSRVQQIFQLAEKLGKKILLEGRSMNNNVEIAHELGYLKFNPRTLITEKELRKLPPEQIIIIGTGAQGEKNAALMRMATGEHPYLTVQPHDTVIFSSSVIPGNERTIQNLKDILYRCGARVIHYKMMDIHAGGHAKKEDQKLLIRLIQPQYFIPIEANHYLLRMHGETAASVGIPEENIFIPDNGQIMEFHETSRGNTKHVVGKLTEKRANTEYVMVDGLGVGDVSNIVLRDRRVMADDGMFVVIVTIDGQKCELVGSPDIISRGFIYMKENRELIEDARKKIRKVVKSFHKQPKHTHPDINLIKNKLRDEIGQYLYKKTKRRPMVLPVVIEV